LISSHALHCIYLHLVEHISMLYLVEQWFVFVFMHLNLWFVTIMNYDGLLIYYVYNS
jgi:hypothetical protein